VLAQAAAKVRRIRKSSVFRYARATFNPKHHLPSSPVNTFAFVLATDGA